MANLAGMAIEVQQMIIGYLRVPKPAPALSSRGVPSPLDLDPMLSDLRALRLTCKSLERAAFELFGKTYFKDIYVCFERASLMRMTEIAKSSFDRFVRKVIVSTIAFNYRFCDNMNFRERIEWELGRGDTYLSVVCHNEGIPAETRYPIPEDFTSKRWWDQFGSKYHLYGQSQIHVMNNCLGRKAFLEALPHFVALSTVTVSALANDGLFREITHRIGIMLKDYEYRMSPHFSRRVLSIVTDALFETEKVLCGYEIKGISHDPIKHKFAPFNYNSNLLKRWSPLWENHLHAVSLSRMRRGNNLVFIRELLNHCTNLTYLELSFLSTPTIVTEIREQGGDNILQIFSPGFTNLRRLSLGGMILFPAILEAVLIRHQRLRGLEIYDTELLVGRWENFLRYLRTHMHLSHFTAASLRDPIETWQYFSTAQVENEIMQEHDDEGRCPIFEPPLNGSCVQRDIGWVEK